MEVTDFDESTALSQSVPSGSVPMTVGGILLVLAFAAGFYALRMETTVDSSPYGGGGTYNLGLLQQQMIALHIGLALGIAGFLGIFAGAVIDAISGLKGKPE